MKGKGEVVSLNSASHGCRQKDEPYGRYGFHHPNALKEELTKHGVKLLGSGLDEAPFACKDINSVMQNQQQLVNVVG